MITDGFVIALYGIFMFGVGWVAGYAYVRGHIRKYTHSIDKKGAGWKAVWSAKVIDGEFPVKITE